MHNHVRAPAPHDREAAAAGFSSRWLRPVGGSMNKRIAKIWNFDFRHTRMDRLPVAQVVGFFLATILTGALVSVTGIFEGAARIALAAADGQLRLFDGALRANLAHGLVGVMAVMAMGAVAYPFWRAFFGPNRAETTPVVWANGLTALIDLIATTLLFLVVGLVVNVVRVTDMGSHAAGAKAIGDVKRAMTAFVDQTVPSIVEIPAPFSIATWVLLSGFTFYALHRLCHTSRLFWLMFHRAHHAPAHLAGIIAPVSIFAVLSTIPMTVLYLVIDRLFHSSVGVSALGNYVPNNALSAIFIVQFLHGASDISSHQTALYGMAFRNRAVRFFFHATSGGPYHYVHHSSKPDEQMVNLDVWGPFMIWDRIFGTYRPPTAVRPRVGLTNDPEIRLSPFLILYGGYQQLAFELRHNHDFRTRLRIVFGSVKYRPPVSCDFLILGGPPGLRPTQ